jgi:hypothetical protein
MNRGAVRYLVTAELLRAAGPLPLGALLRVADRPRPAVMNALWDLIDEGLVLEVDGEGGPDYVWRARWRGPRSRLAKGERHPPTRDAPGDRPDDLDIGSETIAAFHDFVIRRYSPPADKPWLALFQCSVRRPFSKSPSHASMRRAVEMATGFDPARRFHECPVHVVVLASRIGPVPYELEDFYPANVRGGGVKHFANDIYAEVRPVLVERMAEYLVAHGGLYERAAAFGDSRYGEVMAQAAERAGVDLPIFPRADGPQITRLGETTPRTYWQKCWIQLTLEILDWLPPGDREAALARLEDAGVEYA